MKKFLSSNVLKLIACIAMVFDHIGKISYLFFPSDTMYWLDYSFSIIGRIALPIFIFLLIEGFYHTTNIKKYFLRLGIMALIIGICEIILSLIPSLNLADTLFKSGNIFIDLLLLLLILFLINQKDIKLKILSALPLIYFIISLLLQNDTIYIYSEIGKGILSGFMCQYSFVSPLLLILFLLIHYLYLSIVKRKYSEKELSTIDQVGFKKDVRINSYIIAVTLLSLLMYLFTYVIDDTTILNTNYVINTYFIISIVFIFFYNGKLGKNNIYIKSAYYLFYPLHLGIIFLITYLISLF